MSKDKLVINRLSWDALLAYHAEKMGEQQAQQFMDANFILADHVPIPRLGLTNT